jgi:N-acetylneuraminate synthase
MSFSIGNTKIGGHNPVYFIADIASNHGGDLELAKELIYSCKDAGVNAVKMQNFSAETIVSDYGFKNLGDLRTHQSNWKTSVFDSYKAASIPFEWTLELKTLAESLGMSYFTSPYSLELVELVAPYVSAFKLGSGDITWHEEIAVMAKHDKPLLIATGASNMSEVIAAMDVARTHTDNILLMQCNTNYTARHGEPAELTRERMSSINLRVLEAYSKAFPGIPLGLSDHTHGSLTVLGAVGLFGCSAVEKHFTLDSSQSGQDHPFSMMPGEWLKMVQQTALLKTELKDDMTFTDRIKLLSGYTDYPEYLKLMLGNGVKEVQENEKNTVVVQRRAIRAARVLLTGEIIQRDDLVVLRPCPPGGYPPYRINDLLGRTVYSRCEEGEHLRPEMITG